MNHDLENKTANKNHVVALISPTPLHGNLTIFPLILWPTNKPHHTSSKTRTYKKDTQNTHIPREKSGDASQSLITSSSKTKNPNPPVCFLVVALLLLCRRRRRHGSWGAAIAGRRHSWRRSLPLPDTDLAPHVLLQRATLPRRDSFQPLQANRSR